MRERSVSARGRHPGVPGSRSRIQGRLQALIETIVVPETWSSETGGVCRARSLRSRRMAAEHARDASLLSGLFHRRSRTRWHGAARCACSAKPVRIDAIDICGRALDHARRGIYGKGSFRGDVAGYRERYFERVTEGHSLSRAVRPQVNFQQGNLLNAGFLPGSDIYDVVFCRNLLIYFDRATQDQAVSVLDRLLTPNGMLFAGSSESGVFVNHSFSSAKLPMAFAFRKGRAVAKPKPPAAVTWIRRIASRPPIRALPRAAGG